MLQARPELERLTTREGGNIFVDFGGASLLEGTWDTVYAHHRRSHYSSNFSESVTNSVYWLDPNDPAPKLIESGGRVTAIELSDPKGVRFQIPVH